MLKFGVGIRLNPPPAHSVSLGTGAEQAGFSRVWVFDSNVLWQDPYPVLTMLAERTKRVTLGTCVTNPETRHWTVTASAFSTLQDVSGGRMILGIARGDSALRAIGKRPSSLETLESTILRIRGLVRGEVVEFDGTSVRAPWSSNDLPIYVGATGPEALRLAGRVADGVIIQTADPFIVEWMLAFVRRGAEEAGRDFNSINVQCAGASYISSNLGEARQQVRWFAAVVARHTAPVLERYRPDGLPRPLTQLTELGLRGKYDYSKLGRPDDNQADALPDELVDRFTVIGPAEACIARLEELASLGVHEWNVYASDVSDPAKLIAEYGRNIIPRF